MKRLKMLITTMTALAIFFSGSFAAHAAASSSAAGSQDAVVTAAESSEAASASSEAAMNADGAVNAAPNTGVAFPPMAAVFLALACVPIILLTSKRPASGTRE